MKKSDIPNYLTYSRIVAIPFIIILALSENENLRWLALMLFALAAITDFFDGYLARKWGTTSPVGQMLDPIADKLLVGALLIAFAYDGTFSSLDLIPAIAIMMREIFISGLREFMGNKKIVLKVSILAKYKTTVQLVALGLLFAEPMMPAIALISDVLLWLAAILTLITGWQYWQGASDHLRSKK
ncbi:MAG: CDP-diacylglycerol--glycerol-3-phosphate 3-phosphatidyltransferase [Devosiaceae bacterium]|nr:CDP-diacylglycerol--glycerol-3-phosphate 3-phosphatidyltransferase [Devosiaceae bacterium]